MREAAFWTLVAAACLLVGGCDLGLWEEAEPQFVVRNDTERAILVDVDGPLGGDPERVEPGVGFAFYAERCHSDITATTPAGKVIAHVDELCVNDVWTISAEGQAEVTHVGE